MAVVKKKRKVWWIVGGVLGFFVLEGFLLLTWYVKHQESIAEESAHQVERALKQLDDDETAKEIRAQLVDTGHGQLENDFVLEGDHRSLHVANAVSPAFTCAWPFAAHVVDQLESRAC